MGSTERRWFSLLILGLTVSYSHSSRQQPSFELQARFLLKNHFCTMTKFKRLQIGYMAEGICMVTAGSQVRSPLVSTLSRPKVAQEACGAECESQPH